MESPDVPIQPASTVVCLRDGVEGLEVLLVRRNSKLVFHGGAWVFPGGRVDFGDLPDPALDPNALSEEAASRRAAVRETREEASLTIGEQELVPLSHWTTPPGRPRRFSTWFFIARTATGDVQVDAAEIDEHWWATPEVALRSQASNEIELPPPTFVTLVWASKRNSVEDALTLARTQPFERYVPRPVLRPDGVVSLYGGDAGYETRDVDRPGTRNRLWMVRSGWRYEREPPGGY